MALYSLVRPLAFALDGEVAHRLTIRSLKLAPAGRPAKADPVLKVNVAGLDFPNPVGLAAGFDKDAEVWRQMLGFGFGGILMGNIADRLGIFRPLLGAGGTLGLGYIATAAGLIGIALAFVFYVAAPGLADTFKNLFSMPYRWLSNKYYVDEAYDSTIVQPVIGGSKSFLWRGMDAGLIDGFVNGVAARARNVGGGLRLLQSGYIRRYAAWVVLGSIVIVAVVSFWGGVR